MRCTLYMNPLVYVSQYIPHYRVYIRYRDSDSSNVAQSYHDVTIITIGFIPDDATNILLSNLSDIAEVQSFCILDYN